VVLSGAIELVQPVGAHEEPIIVLGPGQFTGEINMLSARRSLVQRDSELSEILCSCTGLCRSFNSARRSASAWAHIARADPARFWRTVESYVPWGTKSDHTSPKSKFGQDQASRGTLSASVWRPSTRRT
jgi:hypothetical protein